MSFTVEVRDRGPITAILLSGELDMATAGQLQATVERLIAAGRQHLLLELDGLTFCDSAGLNTFVQGERQCAARGGWLRLTGARGHVARVLTLSEMDTVLGYRGEAEAAAPDADAEQPDTDAG